MIIQITDKNIYHTGKITFIGYFDANLQKALGYIRIVRHKQPSYQVSYLEFEENYQKFNFNRFFEAKTDKKNSG